MSARAQHCTLWRMFAGLPVACALTILSLSESRAAITFVNTARLVVDVGADGTQAIALADVNKDNRPDILAVSQATNQVNVFLNDGNGGFAGGPTPFNVGGGPVAVATGDFDLDGNVDIVTVNGDSTTVTILYGDSTGAFNASRQDYTVGNLPVAVAVADYNNDQRPDLAVLSDSTVYLLGSNGNRTFTPFSPASIGTRGNGGIAITSGFLNADPFPDLVISNIDSDNVSVFIGNGDGTFKAARLLNTGSGPDGIVTGDWNGDAKQDIAVVDSGEFADLNVSLLFGNGDGMFQDSIRTTAQVFSVAIAKADLDGNGRLDFAVTNVSGDNTVSVLLYDPSAPNAEAGFSLQDLIRGLSLGQGQVAVQAADLNNDGLPDLIALAEDTTTIGVFINGGLAPLATPTPTPQPSPTPIVHLNIGNGVGRPGDVVDVTVSLAAGGMPVAATGNDIIFDGSALAFDVSACHINPAITKTLVGSVVSYSDFSPFKTVRFFVQTDQRTDPIPDGALYHCPVRITSSALPAVYGLYNGGAVAFDPTGSSFDVGVENGSITVSLVAGPSPTPTAVPGHSGGSGCVMDGGDSNSCYASIALLLLPVLLVRWRVRSFDLSTCASPQPPHRGSRHPCHG